MTYSLTRFAIYETVRDHVTKGSEGPLPFHKKVLLGAISGELPAGPGAGGGAGGQRPSPMLALGSVVPGCIGGFVGTPADMVNVRSVCAPPPPRSGSFLTPDGAGGLTRWCPQCVQLGTSAWTLGSWTQEWEEGAGRAPQRAGLCVGRTWPLPPLAPSAPEPVWWFQDAERREAAPESASQVSGRAGLYSGLWGLPGAMGRET